MPWRQGRKYKRFCLRILGAAENILWIFFGQSPVRWEIESGNQSKPKNVFETAVNYMETHETLKMGKERIWYTCISRWDKRTLMILIFLGLWYIFSSVSEWLCWGDSISNKAGISSYIRTSSKYITTGQWYITQSEEMCNICVTGGIRKRSLYVYVIESLTCNR